MTDTAAPTYKGKTAAEWRAAAADARKRSQESWERSDTDGFLSQWAMDSVAREYDLCAALTEQGGMIETEALFLLDGTLASVEMVDGQYGAQWVIMNGPARVALGGKRWLSPSYARKAETRRANMAKKGVTVGTIRVRGEVKMVGKTYTSVRPIIVADEDALRNGEFEIVSTDNG